MKHSYIFSGLGADERVFKYLDLAACEPVFIKWITPLPGESIEGYAERIAQQITAANPVLIGLSFGGMMAIEVAKHIAVEKVILIASAKTKKEIPFYYRMAGVLKLNRLLPVKLMKAPTFFTHWLFGAKTGSEKKMLTEILRDTDPVFLKWAIDKIVHWKNETIPLHTFHLHGTADRILPIRFVDCDAPIIGGGHLMILDKAEEINEQLKSIIS